MNSKKLLGNLSLIIAALFWGSTFVAQEIGMNHIRPFTFLASRSLLGFLFLFILAPIIDIFKKKNNSYEKPTKAQKKITFNRRIMLWNCSYHILRFTTIRNGRR